MSRLEHKNTTNSRHGNTSLPEAGYPTIAGSEYSNISKAQENDLNTNDMKMLEALKEEINKSVKEIQKNTGNWENENPLKKAKKKNTQLKEMNITVQDLKIKTIKKMQTEDILEMKILRLQIGNT